MDHLWPHLSLHNAANQLYKAAHYARRATGAADCVSLRNEIVTLFGARTVTVDVACVRVLRCGRSGQWRAAGCGRST